MEIQLYNTLSKETEQFRPLISGRVGVYACGPTVYDFAHIGNLRTYVFEDVLKRVLKYNGYKVKHIMNVTDVGHLVGDTDEGEDKIERGAKREGKNARELANFYIKAFKNDMTALNIESPTTWCQATDHIKDQINLIKKLEKKGYTYKTIDGIYFDTSKLSDYGKLANLEKQELLGGARVKIGDKKNITDFALWKFSPKLEKRQMEWKSPWGVGFPGWHIECSAMSVKYLGQPFDIHCGGIDHIPVHHTNEIAQSEAANDSPLSNFWLHGEFLLVEDEKMAKSKGNFYTLETLKDRGLSPLGYRFFLLQAHYRKQLKFNWDALKSAESGLKHFYRLASELKKGKQTRADEIIEEKFHKMINNDLDTPGALALIWEGLKSGRLSLSTLLKFDSVLGLEIEKNIKNIKKSASDIPAIVKKTVSERDLARAEKNWQKSDELRKKIEEMGYAVEDSPEGTRVKDKR